jgi:hypothetical protein
MLRRVRLIILRSGGRPRSERGFGLRVARPAIPGHVAIVPAKQPTVTTELTMTQFRCRFPTFSIPHAGSALRAPTKAPTRRTIISAAGRIASELRVCQRA